MKKLTNKEIVENLKRYLEHERKLLEEHKVNPDFKGCRTSVQFHENIIMVLRDILGEFDE